MSGLLSFVIGFMSIALMVTIHETGHFVVARLSGITVEVFAIGWGKPIKRWRSKGIEYRINMFPLGGYCRIKGAEDLRRSLDSGNDTVTQAEPGSLFSVSPLRRIPTFFAGSLFNLMFALILFIPFLTLDSTRFADPNQIVISSDYPRVFGTIPGEPNPAYKAGLRTGDVILAVQGEPISHFNALQSILAERPADTETTFTFSRNGTVQEVAVIPAYDTMQKRSVFGVATYIEPVIATILPDSIESTTPLQEGDRILRVGDRRTDHTVAVMDALLSYEAQEEITFTVRSSDGTEREIRYTPEVNERGNSVFNFSFVRPTEVVPGLPFGRALVGASKETFNAVRDTLQLVPMLFSGTGELRDSVAGPLRISYVIGEMRNAGIRAVLHLLAMVSISLSVVNLLPIPGLDGGTILLTLIEAVRGRPISSKWYVRYQSIGVAFLMILVFFVMSGDIRFFLLGG